MVLSGLPVKSNLSARQQKHIEEVLDNIHHHYDLTNTHSLTHHCAAGSQVQLFTL